MAAQGARLPLEPSALRPQTPSARMCPKWQQPQTVEGGP